MRRVATVGSFDILHLGHYEHLEFARNLGDYLLVVIVPDRIVYENKGERPVIDEQTRASNLIDAGIADEVVIDCLSNGYHSILDFHPDVFVFGPDQKTEHDLKTISLLENNGIHPTYCFSNSPKHYHSHLLRHKAQYPK